jgi:hypothetical protein
MIGHPRSKLRGIHKESNATQNQAGCTAECGPGCNCSASGIDKKGKIIICLVVAIAAAIVLAYGFMQKAEAQSDLGQSTLEIADETNLTDSSLWGNPIESLAYLSQVASQKDAVFLYLPIKGQGPDENIKKEIQSAASKAQSKGTMVAFFALDEGSEDYAQLTSQVPAPSVLVMVKGSNLSAVPANISEESGMGVVSGNISEENLLYAMVAASRPSVGCCVLPSTNSSSAKCC